MFTFREAYATDEPRARAALVGFIDRIHGLDLTRWGEAGYWDSRYRPFSYFDGEEVVSHVCLYSLDMVVNGRRCKVAQISAVGTREDLRRKGLNCELTERAMAWARENDHAFFFLFSDEDAIPYYEGMGFRSAGEHVPFVEIAGAPPVAGALRLDVDRSSDRRLLAELATRRASVSEALGVLSMELFMFHALYTLTDHLYHIPELEVLVAVQPTAGGMCIQDVVGPRIPAFDDILPFVNAPAATEVSFGFLPDRLGLPDWQSRATRRNNLYLHGECPVDPGRLIVPTTAHA